MPDLLIELFSEEIPARMQARAEADLLKQVTAQLAEAGLPHGGAFGFSGPRRLGVVVEEVAARSEDVREERKGPKIGAPDKALTGFMRGAGLSSLDDAEIRSDPKKGDFYVAVLERPGRPAADLIADFMPELIGDFHWPKSMRSSHGDLRWVRPLQRIVCLLGGKRVPFEVDGIKSGNETEGHRVHGRGPFKVKGWADYCETLEGEGHVRLLREDRKAMIAQEARGLCAARGLELVEDVGLLEELAGLAEWPVVLLGDMEPRFLELPPEVIRLTMRTHQKYFAVRDPKSGELAPHFVVVANIEAEDGGATIAAGNAKVLAARLEDARFFWENDRRTGLEAMAPKLADIAFKEELGSMADKVERVAALARELAPKVGADPDLAETAARLAKADLVSEMVYEFPELQGVMGRYYALEALNSGVIPAGAKRKAGTQTADGQTGSRLSGAGAPAAGMTAAWAAGLSEDDIRQIADAIRDHYKPQGPADDVPTAPVSIAAALADKLDTLVGFWAIDEKPTGSKDPFALRRAALGVVRIVLENELRLKLRPILSACLSEIIGHAGRMEFSSFEHIYEKYVRDWPFDGQKPNREWILQNPAAQETIQDLLAFFADRLKVHLRDEGKRHDLIDAVFALGEDDLVLIVKRVEALTDFLASEDGENLLTGYRRAANILKDEEKRDRTTYEGAPDPALFSEPAEHDLHSAIERARAETDAALKDENFEAAMSALAQLRGPVDAFFDTVRVNVEDARLRRNRLLILASIRDALHAVADFSKIEG